EICGFRLHGANAPFRVLLLNGTTGEGSLRVTGKLDCEARSVYTLSVQAKMSHRATVRVRVSDVNEFSPLFSPLAVSALVTLRGASRTGQWGGGGGGGGGA
ncbi:unnamed protein product, partial [Lampetra fluviatilis]